VKSANEFEVKEEFKYLFFFYFFMKKVILIIMLGLLVGCSQMNAETCAEQGGTWGMAEYDYVCYFETSDAFEPCSDSSECELECVTYNEDVSEAFCYPHEPFVGCANVVENGEVTGTICS
jgi:hypothetical protein